MTYNGDIAIPAGAVGHVESKSCSVPVGAKFWLMSTHAHKQATSTAVKNGTQVAFSSTDWEHPGVKAWMTPAAFYSFTDKMTYECTYTNESNRIIDDGDSAQTDEMCMATGFYFVPGGNATPRFCYNESSF